MSGTSLISSIPSYVSISRNEAQRIAQYETTDPHTKSDIAYIVKQAPKLTTVDALLKDYRSLSIVLNAFGLGDHIGQTALLRKLMTQDPTSKNSVAYELGDPTLTRFAKAMGQFSPPPFASAGNIQAIITASGTNNFEAAQDLQSPGIANALYFKRSIAGLTNIQQIMSDPKLLAVATTATNMPDQFGTLSYDQQVTLLSAKITMKNFSNPLYVDTFVSKYLAIQTASTIANTDTTGALSILTGSGSSDNMLGALFPSTGVTAGDNSLLSLFA